MHLFSTLPAANDCWPFEVRHSNGTLISNNSEDLEEDLFHLNGLMTSDYSSPIVY